MKSSRTLSVRVITTLFLTASIALSTHTLKAQQGLELENDTLTKTVLIHRPIDAGEGGLKTSEHTYRSQLRLGDQLGRDFTVSKLTTDGISRTHINHGKTNEDWFGWRKPVLAPMDAKVTRVEQPDTVNTPGTMNREAQPGLIFFKNQDSVTVIYAHAREIEVEEGQHVAAGDTVGKVGNNGNSRNPHIHVGAWKKETPLQIQVDLYANEREEYQDRETNSM